MPLPIMPVKSVFSDRLKESDERVLRDAAILARKARLLLEEAELLAERVNAHLYTTPLSDNIRVDPDSFSHAIGDLTNVEDVYGRYLVEKVLGYQRENG